MDQFTVPKFIEHKTKIIGPLTLQQFIFVGTAGALAFFLYFVAPFPIFLMAAIVLVGGGTALAFGKIEGRPLPEILKGFFSFLFKPKLYLWRKKVGPPPKLRKEPAPKPGEPKEPAVPAVAGKSRLKNLSIHIETK